MDSAEAVVDLTIRDAELTDAAAMAALIVELGYETTAAEMAARLQAICPTRAIGHLSPSWTIRSVE